MEIDPVLSITACTRFVLPVFLCSVAVADDKDAGSFEALAERSRRSVVVIKSADREGEQRGLGTGFIVRSDGVIVTNFHVIGKGRAFRVQLADGKTYEPEMILAIDRRKDLAVIQIGARDLPVLPLGDSAALKPGQTVLAVGNPLGLEFSVSRGVVAARRDLDGRDMIQVAIPLEPGSSGSPVMDLEGRVVGVLAIKSAAALGFAVPVEVLKPLLEDFRPVKMSRWLTIGALDDRDWQTVLGGSWRQRAGRLIASGSGEGFGARMLCLSRRAPPDGPFEIEVEVRLEDESGAAGLVFHSDGQFNHYGFYPTAGSMRLTRFEGPTVFNWTILRTVPSAAYRPGEWNRIRVRVDGSRLSCSINGQSVVEIEDAGLSSGSVGLVKFREPAAEFRRFRLGAELPRQERSAEMLSRIEALLSSFPEGEAMPPRLVDKLAAVGPGASEVLRERAASLEKEAARLKILAGEVHGRSVVKRLVKALESDDGKDTSLFHAALLISLLDNPDLEVETYLKGMNRMVEELRERFDANSTETQKLDALVAYLFEDLGFHGSRSDYYHRSNSYMNEVIDDREGLPITLAVIFIELASRLGLPVSGLGVQGHFLAAYRLGEETERIVDVFGGGETVSRDEAAVLSATDLSDEDFRAASKRSIVVRMLQNLLNVAEREQDLAATLRYLNVLVAVEPDPVYRRGLRAMLLYGERRFEEAAEDLDWIIERNPPGVDLDALRGLRASIPGR